MSMKLTKTQKIAGYKSELSLKTNSGSVLKRFNSTSGVDFAQADQNCYKRAEYWINRVIILLKGEKSYLEQYEQEKINTSKITLKEALELKEKLSKIIIRPVVKEIEI